MVGGDLRLQAAVGEMRTQPVGKRAGALLKDEDDLAFDVEAGVVVVLQLRGGVP